jgi:hypothetical protein
LDAARGHQQHRHGADFLRELGRLRGLRADPEGAANFQSAEEGRFILAEERTFLRQVE